MSQCPRCGQNKTVAQYADSDKHGVWIKYRCLNCGKGFKKPDKREIG